MRAGSSPRDSGVERGSTSEVADIAAARIVSVIFVLLTPPSYGFARVYTGRQRRPPMHIAYPPELLRELTRSWEGERFPDGRPRVPDDVVERMRPVTTEEAWGTLRRNGHTLQFEGNWFNTHPSRVLVG